MFTTKLPALTQGLAPETLNKPWYTSNSLQKPSAMPPPRIKSRIWDLPLSLPVPSSPLLLPLLPPPSSQQTLGDHFLLPEPPGIKSPASTRTSCLLSPIRTFLSTPLDTSMLQVGVSQLWSRPNTAQCLFFQI